MDEKRLRSLVDPSLGLVYREQTGSTSDDVRNLLTSRISLPFVVVASSQTGGRGRRGNSFASPVGGAYLTLALPSSKDNMHMELLTSALGIAACDAIESLYPQLNLGIKWVNDVYLDDRKLGGILVEHVTSNDDVPVVLVGIGINVVNTPAVAGDVRPSSLSEFVRAHELDLERIVAVVANAAYRVFDCLPNAEQVIEECRRRSVLFGHRITYTCQGVTCKGVAENIDFAGKLLVRQDDGSLLALSSAAANIRLL